MRGSSRCCRNPETKPLIEVRHPRPGRLDLPGLQRFMKRAQAAAGVGGEVGVRLVDDVTIRDLNRQFRGRNSPTDVLSFPLFSGSYAGDVAISLDRAAMQARQQGHGVQVEIKILLLHGLLHLAGMDHETDEGEMLARELSLRRRFRLPAGLIERSQ